MSGTSVLHWVSKHGVTSLYDIVDALDRGIAKQTLARRYDTENTQFSRFLKDVVEVHHLLKPEVVAYLKEYSQMKTEKMEAHDRRRAEIIELHPPASGSESEAESKEH